VPSMAHTTHGHDVTSASPRAARGTEPLSCQWPGGHSAAPPTRGPSSTAGAALQTHQQLGDSEATGVRGRSSRRRTAPPRMANTDMLPTEEAIDEVVAAERCADVAMAAEAARAQESATCERAALTGPFGHIFEAGLEKIKRKRKPAVFALPPIFSEEWQ
jgi:hypothetical protein